MPKIIFLGTAGTLETINKTARYSSSFILEADDKMLLFNPGPGTLVRLSQEKIDIEKIDAILVSTERLININDLHAISLHNRDLKIYSESSISHHIPNIDIKAINVKENKLAYIIGTSRFILCHLPTGHYTKKLIEEFKDANILIIDCNDELEKDNLLELIEEVSPELVILTGFGLNIIKDDPLDFSRNLKKELQERGKVDGIHLKTQIIPAKDGMQLNTEHYNIRLKQKSLKGFV